MLAKLHNHSEAARILTDAEGEVNVQDEVKEKNKNWYFHLLFFRMEIQLSIAQLRKDRGTFVRLF